MSLNRQFIVGDNGSSWEKFVQSGTSTWLCTLNKTTIATTQVIFANYRILDFYYFRSAAVLHCQFIKQPDTSDKSYDGSCMLAAVLH